MTISPLAESVRPAPAPQAATVLNLDTIEARANAASQGWEIHLGTQGSVQEGRACVIGLTDGADFMSVEDAAFVVAARADVLGLADEVRVLRTAVSGYARALEILTETIGPSVVERAEKAERVAAAAIRLVRASDALLDNEITAGSRAFKSAEEAEAFLAPYARECVAARGELKALGVEL